MAIVARFSFGKGSVAWTFSVLACEYAFDKKSCGRYDELDKAEKSMAASRNNVSSIAG